MSKEQTVNRRSFLKASMAGAVVTTAGQDWLGRPSKRQDDALSDLDWDCKVVIVGAGAAGLYGGYLLHQFGADVTVLEATGQPGGRIRTLKGFADYPVELGAEFVNGRDNILRRYARDAGVELFAPKRGGQDYLVADGRLLSEAEAARLPAARAAYRLLEDMTRYRGPDVTVANYVASRKASRITAALTRYVGTELASSNEALSLTTTAPMLKAALTNNEDLERPRVPYLELLRTMREALAGRIIYNSPVTSLDYRQDTVVVKTPARQWEADKVILTVPLPVLQKRMIVFRPELPDVKLRAIDHLHVGPAMKVILKFSRRFWDAPLQTVTSGRFATYWPPIGNEYGDDAVLTAYALGEHHQRLKDGRSSHRELLLEELDGLFGRGAATKAFVDSYTVDWAAEPFIGGFVAVPTSTAYFDHKKTLAAPVQNQLFFAGEASNLDPDTIGYVHGAMATAERAVREIAARAVL